MSPQFEEMLSRLPLQTDIAVLAQYAADPLFMPSLRPSPDRIFVHADIASRVAPDPPARSRGER